MFRKVHAVDCPGEEFFGPLKDWPKKQGTAVLIILFSSSITNPQDKPAISFGIETANGPTMFSNNHWDNSHGWVPVAAHSHGPGTCRAPLSCQGRRASSAHRRQPPRSATWGDEKSLRYTQTTLLWSTWSCFIPMNVLTWSLCLWILSFPPHPRAARNV